MLPNACRRQSASRHPSSRSVFGLNGLIAETPAAAWPAFPPETKAATSRISCSLRSPSNEGIPPPPALHFGDDLVEGRIRVVEVRPDGSARPSCVQRVAAAAPGVGEDLRAGLARRGAGIAVPAAPREEPDAGDQGQYDEAGSHRAKSSGDTLTPRWRAAAPGRDTTVSSPRRSQGVTPAPTGGVVSTPMPAGSPASSHAVGSPAACSTSEAGTGCWASSS